MRVPYRDRRRPIYGVGMLLVAIAVFAPTMAHAQDFPPYCRTAITALPFAVTVGEDALVRWTVESNRQVIESHILYRDSTQPTDQLGPTRMGTGEFNATINTGQFALGTTVVARPWARTDTGHVCLGDEWTIRIVGPPCSTRIIGVPDTVEEGDPIPVTWEAGGTEEIIHTNIHVRRAGTLTEWPGPTLYQSAGTFTDNIPTTAFVVGDVLQVRSHVQTRRGDNCYSVPYSVAIVPRTDTICYTTIDSIPLGVEHGDPLDVTFSVTGPGTVIHANVHWRVTGATSENPLPVHMGTGTWTDTLGTSGFAVGTTLIVRSHARTDAGQNCYSAEYAVAILPRSGPPCVTSIDSIPIGVRRGDPLPVTFTVASANPIVHANIHWQVEGSPVERPGPVHTGTGTWTNSIDTSPYLAGAILLVRSHARTDDGRSCYSPDHRVVILAPNGCEVFIRSAPSFVAPGDDIVFVWEVAAHTAVIHTNIHWRTPGDALETPSPVETGPGPHTFALSTVGWPVGTTIIARAHAVVQFGNQCFSDPITITVDDAIGGSGISAAGAPAAGGDRGPEAASGISVALLDVAVMGGKVVGTVQVRAPATAASEVQLVTADGAAAGPSASGTGSYRTVIEGPAVTGSTALQARAVVDGTTVLSSVKTITP